MIAIDRAAEQYGGVKAVQVWVFRVRTDRRQVRGSLPWPRRVPLAGPGRPVPDVTRAWAFGQQWSRRVTR